MFVSGYAACVFVVGCLCYFFIFYLLSWWINAIYTENQHTCTFFGA